MTVSSIRTARGHDHPARRTPHSALRTRTGQALLELAILGSLVLLMLGALISYGLNADFQQEVVMESFRTALGNAAAHPQGSGQALILKDRHIPSPSNPFGIGNVFAVSGQSGLTWSYLLHHTPNALADLPKLTMKVNKTTMEFKTAGFKNDDPGTKTIDPCEGELLNFDRCKAKCLEDSSPWYCSKLNQMFTGIRDMGLQPGVIRNSDMTNSLQKDESATQVQTTSQVDWQAQTSRDVVSIGLTDTSGTVNPATITSTPVNQHTSTTWSTDW